MMSELPAGGSLFLQEKGIVNPDKRRTAEVYCAALSEELPSTGLRGYKR